jgi:uroporphyrinogen-III decarboxylase
MTPAERVATALRGGRPDRVPFVPKIWVDFSARFCGVSLRDVIEDPVTALAVILRAGRGLGLDGVRQFALPARRTEEAGDRLWEIHARTGRRIGAIDLAGGLHTLVIDASDFRLDDPVNMAHFHHRRPPGPAVTKESDAAAIAVPDARLLDDLGFGRNQDAALAGAGSAAGSGGAAGAASGGEPVPAIIQDCGPIGLAFLVALDGMNQALLDLVDRPHLVHATLDKGDAIAIAKGAYWLDRGYRMLRINDSAGNLSVISPEHWRTFVKPHFTAVASELHRRCPASLLYCHVCGNVLPIIGDLADTGLDCIAPLDPLGGFTVADARRALEARPAAHAAAGCVADAPSPGRPVALMGGINTLSFVDGTPDAVGAEAEACIAGARAVADRGSADVDPGPGAVPAGFILGSGCVVPRGARVECLIRAREVAHRGVSHG